MSFKNFLDLRKKIEPQLQIIERVVIQKRSLKSDLFLTLSVILVASAVIWGISKADVDEYVPQSTETNTNTENTLTIPKVATVIESIVQASDTSTPVSSEQSDTNNSDDPVTPDSIDNSSQEFTALLLDSTANVGTSSIPEVGPSPLVATETLATSTDLDAPITEGAVSDIVEKVKDFGSEVKDAIGDTLEKVTYIFSATSSDVSSEQTATIEVFEQDTNTGKLVTVSSPDENPETPLVDVLASATIPEIYKVGEENKIHIKWKSEGDQEMSFHAFDTDLNGYLDYVEWTIPHLSTQVFEIIFISKAFQLDENQNIIADIYDTVKTQDENYATISDGQYVRVAFEKILSEKNDITLFARSTDYELPTTNSIEVYPVYADENGNVANGPLVAVFENISEAQTYKVLLTDLESPTDLFDLKVIGSVDFDYIVDPTGWAGSGTGIDPWQVNSCGTADTLGYYTLTTNLSISSGDCINITATGVILNGVSTYSITNTGTGKGVYIWGGAEAILQNVDIINSDAGVGVWNYGVLTDITGTVTNSGSANGGVGKGVYNGGNSATITDISGTVINSSADGYGIYSGSGVDVTITDISGTVTNNSSEAGIYNDTGSTITDISGTITNDSAGGDSAGIQNNATILQISGDVTNVNYGNGVWNYGTVSDISGTFSNSGNGIGFSNDGGFLTIVSTSTIITSTGGDGFINYGTINGSGTISGVIALEQSGVLDLSSGLTIRGTIEGGGASITPVDPNVFSCASINKSLGSINDGSADYAMCSNLFHWVGGNSDNGYFSDAWENPANWLEAMVPPNGADIEISDSSLNNVVINSTVTIGDLTLSYSFYIENYGTITDITGTINCNLSVCIENSNIITDISGTFNNTGTGRGISNFGTIADISGNFNVTASGVGIFNGTGGVIDNMSGTTTNSSSGTGIYNEAVISGIGGVLINSGTGIGIYTEGTITNISGMITNSSSGIGISNDNIITDISGIITNSGSGTGVYNNSGTISDISGTITNSGGGYGINNISSTITTISGTVDELSGTGTINIGATGVVKINNGIITNNLGQIIINNGTANTNTFNGQTTSSYNGVNGIVTGDATFQNTSYNSGLVTGNAIFQTGSMNDGSVTGDATFSYLTATSGVVIDTTRFANGRVSGITKDSVGATITTWTFNNTNNNGFVTGDAIFNNSRTNDTTVSGSSVFNGTSRNNGTVNGTSTLNGTSRNTGTTATLVLNTLTATSGAITFSGSTAFLGTGSVTGSIKDSLGVTITKWVFRDSSTNSGFTKGTSLFYDNSANANTISGNAHFSNSSTNTGTVTGNADIYYPHTMPMTGGTISGTKTYHSYPNTISFNPATSDYAWNTISNWFTDATLLTPLGRVPTASENVVLFASSTMASDTTNDVYVATSSITLNGGGKTLTGSIFGNGIYGNLNAFSFNLSNITVTGTTTANGATGTNGGTGGTINIATSTTGVIVANGANGTSAGGNGGTIIAANSDGILAGTLAQANGGNASTNCGTVGVGGDINITNSDNYTAESIDGTGTCSSAPTGGTRRTTTVTPRPVVTSNSTPSASTNSGSRSFVRNTINQVTLPVQDIKPLKLAPLPTFGEDKKGSFSFKLPLQIFLFNSPNTSAVDNLKKYPKLQKYISDTLGLNSDQKLVALYNKPLKLDANAGDVLGIFKVISPKGNPLVTTLKIDKKGNLSQYIKINEKDNYQTLNLSLAITSKTAITGKLSSVTSPSVIPDSVRNPVSHPNLSNDTKYTFTNTKTNITTTINIPQKAGTYTFTASASPLPLVIEVTGTTNATPNISSDTNKQSLWSKVKSWFGR
jgi:hypothetical protein